jgi:acyl-CoA thioesterase I
MRSLRGLIAVALSGVALAACGGGKGTASATDERIPIKAASAAEGSADSPSTVAPSGSAQRGTVLFLGTSLTAGFGLEPDSAFPQQIQRKIDAAGLPYQTVNAGVSGETSAGLLRRLDWVLQRPAEVIVVETGANDGLRGQPVTGTRATIGRILERIRRERPNARLVLMQMEAPTNLGPTYTSAFRSMFLQLAREHRVTLVPFLLDRVAGEPRLNQPDGIHPNYEGERIVTENVWRALAPVLQPGWPARLVAPQP